MGMIYNIKTIVYIIKNNATQQKMSLVGGIYEEYFNLQKQYETKYGCRTLVIMQVGAFFEVYGLQEKTQSTSVISDFSSICGLNIADKKATYKGYSVLMAGFKCAFMDKYVALLIGSSYTVVVYIQEDSIHQTKKKHTFYSVYSPGTYTNPEMGVGGETGSGIIMCIWFHIYGKIGGGGGGGGSAGGISRKKEPYVVIGVSVVDINTGKTILSEHETPFLLNVATTFDELEKTVSIYSPSEVIIIYDTPLLRCNIEETIVPFIGLGDGETLIRYINIAEDKYANRCEQQVYIKEILNLFYGKEIDLLMHHEFHQTPIATQSFCYLLNFIQEHNPKLVKKIDLPFFSQSDETVKGGVGECRVRLANHTLKQLNIIDDGGSGGGSLSCVLAFLDKTVCTMGSRRLKHELLNPTYNVEWLNCEYEKIEKCLAHYEDIVIPIRKTLKGVCDIDKIVRKIVMRQMTNIYGLYGGLLIVEKTLALWSDRTVVGIIGIVANLLEFLRDHFVLDAGGSDGIGKIKSGIDDQLDTLVREHEYKKRILSELVAEFNRIYNSAVGTKKAVENAVKIHTTEKSGISLTITKTRGKTLKGVLERFGNGADAGFNINNGSSKTFIPVSDIKMVTSTGNEDSIESAAIKKLCEEIVNLETAISEKTEIVFASIMDTIEESWLESLKQIALLVAEIDLTCTKAYIAHEYNYIRPIIQTHPFTSSGSDGAYDGESDEKSFVIMENLRHVLIEHLVKGEAYVPNNIQLGYGMEKDGLLIFGTNMIGKTSLIRAVGIAVFIAQAGFYVPCSKMIYSPYRSIMTRIVCNDNLFKGISTFAMEMIELRIILRDADKRTLVLGDELGASTEHKSAFSIFMATLIELSTRIRCTFLFTTHFYEILTMSELAELTRLGLSHLEVSYDGNRLHYNRKLMDGPGLANYGLECCKSMYFNSGFMETAYRIRNKYYPEMAGILNWEKSSYNAAKLKGVCEQCGGKMGEEIHHKIPQRDADSRGFIKSDSVRGGIHKNVVGNLMTLCQNCHRISHVGNSHV